MLPGLLEVCVWGEGETTHVWLSQMIFKLLLDPIVDALKAALV